MFYSVCLWFWQTPFQTNPTFLGLPPPSRKAISAKMCEKAPTVVGYFHASHIPAKRLFCSTFCQRLWIYVRLQEAGTLNNWFVFCLWRKFDGNESLKIGPAHTLNFSFVCYAKLSEYMCPNTGRGRCRYCRLNFHPEASCRGEIQFRGPPIPGFQEPVLYDADSCRETGSTSSVWLHYILLKKVFWNLRYFWTQGCTTMRP